MHKGELEKLESDYSEKFRQMGQNEQTLRQNQEDLNKKLEQALFQLAQERAMKAKLQSDFDQNHKNHEEEVALRLKFESKLNQMHAQYRDLDSRYRRVLNNLTIAEKQQKINLAKLTDTNTQITELKTLKAMNESQISQDAEEISSLKGQYDIKNKQARELETKLQQTIRDLDSWRHKTQESQKDNTELKLKIDVLNSTSGGLNSEKKHLELELKETKDLQKIFDNKC